jgi:drug/metabolite transporter (DMT)-like permease
MLIEPLVGVTLAAIVLGESLRPIQVLGGGAILAGALLRQRTRRGPSGETVVPDPLEPAGVPVRDGG